MTDFVAQAEPDFPVLPPVDEAAAIPPLDQWVLRITTPLQRLEARLSQGSEVIAAMQRLVAMIQTVRSPEEGWHPDLAPTPENLLPYVTEEACDVLEALETCLDAAPAQPSDPVESWLSQDLWQNYCLAADFAPQLLWGIVRSSYEVMRLLEGVPAIVVGEDGRSHPGILRLAALLRISIADQPQVSDLVTHYPPSKTLAHTTPLQILAGYVMTAPRPAGDILRTLIQQIRMATPAVLSFLDGVAITALAPQQPWQDGVLSLQMELEFVPEGDRVGAIAPPPLVASTQLQFTDTVWLETYHTTVIQQQLAALIPHLPAYQNMAQADLPPLSEDILPMLIHSACDVADLLQHSPPFLQATVHPEGIALNELLPWLLWCVGRSAYEVMHLIGGLPCQLLQPEADWQPGTLRLLLTLKLQTADQIHYIDLATGQTPEPDVFPLDANVVVQSPNSQWCYQPGLIQHLQTRVMGRIQQAIPELRPLLEGTAVRLLPPEAEPLSAQAQLLIDFDFLGSLKLNA